VDWRGSKRAVKLRESRFFSPAKLRHGGRKEKQKPPQKFYRILYGKKPIGNCRSEVGIRQQRAKEIITRNGKKEDEKKERRKKKKKFRQPLSGCFCFFLTN
jgi:hypothetical protein